MSAKQLEWSNVSVGQTLKVIATGEQITVKDKVRPYGIPYIWDTNGREWHVSQLEE